MDRSEKSRLILLLLALLFVVPCAVCAEETISHTGIYYGYLTDVRPDFSSISAKAIEKGIKRRRFYLDKSTKIYIDGKRKTHSELYFSDKVAIRYFGKGDLLVADAVYVVFGEFEPQDYIAKKQLVVIKKEEGAGEKKDSSH